MSSKTKSFGSRLVSRSALVAAQAAMLCLASSSAMAAIVTSPVTNLSIPNTFEGQYINIVSGATGTSSAGVPGWDFNPYGTASGLGIFWSAAPAGGVGTTAATGPLLVLAPGATIGPSSIFTRAIQATNPNWRQTVDGFLSLAFVNENTGQTNYGYARMTTAVLGFSGVAGMSANIGWLLAVLGVIVLVVGLIGSNIGGRPTLP